MKRRPLSGVRILVGRARHQASALSAQQSAAENAVLAQRVATALAPIVRAF
jgi:hypothetical protein